MKGFIIFTIAICAIYMLVWFQASRKKHCASGFSGCDDFEPKPASLPQPSTDEHGSVRPSTSFAPRTVQLSKRRILIDGKPRQIFAGEVHYFRLKKEEWADRLDKLKANGFDTVATYIPWIWHELPDASVDVDVVGRTHPQRDLAGFLDLCAQRGLDVVARPGPFVMAELKNEGIPYRLYRDPTNLRPTTWHGEPVKTATLDYLSAEFLAAARAWYAQVIPVIAERLATRGGPIIGLQLDNEIGMLSWVSNSPDLTDSVCEDMRTWARAQYGDDVATQRIGADATDSAAWAAALRRPQGDALALHQDLGLYNRDRYRRYVAALRQSAEEHGIRDVPFFVNIHGTGGGRGRTFPVGISQLFETYRGQPQMTSGSDIYLGELTTANVPDLYMINAFMAAMHDADQPTTSLEFEAGDGNYGDDFGNLCSPKATELKARLCVAQGNRLLNYYLHAGGENPPLEGCGDGLDRLAITGQRHGFAAPVGPEGQLNPTYFATGKTAHAMLGIEHLLADSDEENDGFALGFVADHYMTEYSYRGSTDRAAQIADLERFRGAGARDGLVRNLLLGGFSFPAIDLQAGVPNVPCVVLSTGKTLGAQVQHNLAKYVFSGGKLLLTGLLPERDHDGAPCTVLADALGLKSAGRVFDGWGESGLYWASVTAHGWAAPRPDVRVGFAQLLASTDGKPLEPIFTESGSNLPCVVQVRAGAGEAIVFGCDYSADFDLYRQMMARLGIQPRWGLQANYPGVVVTSTSTPDGQRLLHLLNVAPYAVSFFLNQKGKPLFQGRRLELPAQSGWILPLGVRVNNGVIVESTAELVDVDENGFSVRPTQDRDVVVLSTTHDVSSSMGLVVRDGDRVEVRIMRRDHHNEPVRISL